MGGPLGGQPKGLQKGRNYTEALLVDICDYQDRAGPPIFIIKPKTETPDAIRFFENISARL